MNKTLPSLQVARKNSPSRHAALNKTPPSRRWLEKAAELEGEYNVSAGGTSPYLPAVEKDEKELTIAGLRELAAHINQLTDYLQKNIKDHSSRRGLLKMVRQRQRVLDFLNKARDPKASKKLKLRRE